jgi:hypothetical protein
LVSADIRPWIVILVIYNTSGNVRKYNMELVLKCLVKWDKTRGNKIVVNLL